MKEKLIKAMYDAVQGDAKMALITAPFQWQAETVMLNINRAKKNSKFPYCSYLHTSRGNGRAQFSSGNFTFEFWDEYDDNSRIWAIRQRFKEIFLADGKIIPVEGDAALGFRLRYRDENELRTTEENVWWCNLVLSWRAFDNQTMINANFSN